MIAAPPSDDNAMLTERFSIRGDVGSPLYSGWIRRHAARLGLGVVITGQSARELAMTVTGPAPLIDAMALGCSLGPWDVWVDDIIRLEV